MIKEITVEQLKELKQNNADFVLIDVREPHESEISTIGGKLIPLGTVADHVNEFISDKQVVVYCRSGKRSGNAVQLIQELTKKDNLYNLKGGILEWADKIDTSLTKY